VLEREEVIEFDLVGLLDPLKVPEPETEGEPGEDLDAEGVLVDEAVVEVVTE
jgi:hypothetical protein